MKTHTNNFKTNISTNGRELDSKITYTINGTTTVLGVEDLNSITPHYRGDILKSVMKQLDIDSNVDIPIGTIINYQFGVKVGNAYEYLNFGNYVVYSSEKQEDLDSYEIIAYDKLLYSMKNYESLGITYPITIKNYINAICTKLGLTFANINDTFPNYNRQIASELYLTNNKSLGYKYRDVLDELAQVTASTICINNNDELELRYITQTNDTIDEEFFKDINVSFGEKYGPVNSIVLSRSAGSDNVERKDDASILQNGLCQIVIKDNQIMNWEDRTDYLPDLLNALDGLEYYLNDYSSYGIMYYDLGDRYTVSIGNNSYSCVMLNDEANITQDLEEYISTIKPLVSKDEYSNTKKEEIKENRTDIIVDQANQTISQIVSAIGDNGQVTSASIITAINNDTSQVNIQADKINLNGAVTANNNFKINNDGTVEMKNGNLEIINDGTDNTNHIYLYNENDPTQYAMLVTTIFTQQKGNNLLQQDVYGGYRHRITSNGNRIESRLYSGVLSIEQEESGVTRGIVLSIGDSYIDSNLHLKGNIWSEQPAGSENYIIWKELNYADHFLIQPYFNGADDDNKLKIKGGVGGYQEVVPSVDLMTISGKSGNLWVKGDLDCQNVGDFGALQISSFDDQVLLSKSFIGTVEINNVWWNLINVRHRNGIDDGNSYGMQIRCPLTTQASYLEFRQQFGGVWTNWSKITLS